MADAAVNAGLAAVAPAESIIRPATLADLDQVMRLIEANARTGLLLPRTRESVEADLASFLVAVASDQDVVLGTGSLVWLAPDLAEVRSLAVNPSARGRGLGLAIVQELLGRAWRHGARRVLALTQTPTFFERAGFAVAERSEFPEKWHRDCHACPLRERCPETAVVIEL